MSEPSNPNRNDEEGSSCHFTPSHIDSGMNITPETRSDHFPSSWVAPPIQVPEPTSYRNKHNKLSIYWGFAAVASYVLGFVTFVTFLLVPVFAIIAITLAEKDKQQGHNYLLGKVLGWVSLGLFIFSAAILSLIIMIIDSM